MAIQPKHDLTIYTDGACKKLGQGGASSYVIVEDTIIAIGLIASESTTNNQMEMTATIYGLVQALKYLKGQGCTTEASINIYTDSEYVKKGINEWLVNWKRRAWRTSSNEPVKNKNLWIEFDILYTAMKKQFKIVNVKWIKGHAGNAGNEIADFLATAAYPALSSMSYDPIMHTLNVGLPKIVVSYWPETKILPLEEISYNGIWIDNYKDEDSQTSVLKGIINDDI